MPRTLQPQVQFEDDGMSYRERMRRLFDAELRAKELAVNSKLSNIRFIGFTSFILGIIGAFIASSVALVGLYFLFYLIFGP